MPYEEGYAEKGTNVRKMTGSYKPSCFQYEQDGVLITSLHSLITSLHGLITSTSTFIESRA